MATWKWFSHNNQLVGLCGQWVAEIETNVERGIGARLAEYDCTWTLSLSEADVSDPSTEITAQIMSSGFARNRDEAANMAMNGAMLYTTLNQELPRVG